METEERKFYTKGHISFCGYFDSKPDQDILLGLLKGADQDYPWKAKDEQGILVRSPLTFKCTGAKNGMCTFSVQTTRPYVHEKRQSHYHSPLLTMSQVNAFCSHLSTLIKYLEQYKIEEIKHISHGVEFSWTGQTVLTTAGEEARRERVAGLSVGAHVS